MFFCEHFHEGVARTQTQTLLYGPQNMILMNIQAFHIHYLKYLFICTKQKPFISTSLGIFSMNGDEYHRLGHHSRG